VTRAGESIVEPISGEVDGNEPNVARRLREGVNARTLFALGIWMVDLEDDDIAQLGHAPCSTIETCPQDDDLRACGGANGFVDGDRARHHDL
jgi:hypothetical protein